MRSKLGPAWTKAQIAAGQKWREGWEQHFQMGQGAARTAPPGSGLAEAQQKAEAVRARHEAELLRKAHVVGVAVGVRTRGGRPTGEVAIVVYVDEKRPKDALSRQDLLPAQIEGVPVDVVGVGEIEALPR